MKTSSEQEQQKIVTDYLEGLLTKLNVFGKTPVVDKKASVKSTKEPEAPVETVSSEKAKRMSQQLREVLSLMLGDLCVQELERRQKKPAYAKMLEFRKNLPVYQYRDEIIRFLDA